MILCKDCKYWGKGHPSCNDLKECIKHPKVWAPHTYYDCIYTKEDYGCVDAEKRENK